MVNTTKTKNRRAKVSMSKEELTNDEEYLLTMLNKMLLVYPGELTYGNLNKKFPFKENVSMLHEVEAVFPELGLANCESAADGVSILSLMATITHVLCGKRVGVEVDIQDGEDIYTAPIKKFVFAWKSKNWESKNTDK